MKIKKISILVLGCIFALAMILNQLINYVVAYVFNLFPDLMALLSGNVILARCTGFIVLILMGFIIGMLVALIYNLMAKSKKFQLVLETA